MAVTIRMVRYGGKKKPFYRIVVADAERPRNGRFLEIVGTYDTLKNPAAVVVKADRVKSWIEKGATLSDTVRTVLKKHGVIGKETKVA